MDGVVTYHLYRHVNKMQFALRIPFWISILTQHDDHEFKFYCNEVWENSLYQFFIDIYLLRIIMYQLRIPLFIN